MHYLNSQKTADGQLAADLFPELAEAVKSARRAWLDQELAEVPLPSAGKTLPQDITAAMQAIVATDVPPAGAERVGADSNGMNPSVRPDSVIRAHERCAALAKQLKKQVDAFSRDLAKIEKAANANIEAIRPHDVELRRVKDEFHAASDAYDAKLEAEEQQRIDNRVEHSLAVAVAVAAPAEQAVAS